MSKISILMSVYNSERYLAEAIESILGQTFGDFDFIIVDDGSTDRSGEILHSYQDDRIVLLRNETNIGLTKSLNRGLRSARGEYIARLDADDIALPERLAKQAAFLDEHPTVGLVGCAAEYVDQEGNTLGVQRVHDEPVETLLSRHNWFNHSVTAFRRECIETVGAYREAFRYAQDHDLWLRIAESYEVACMAEPLVRIRFRPGSIAARKKAEQRAYSRLATKLACQRRTTGRDLLDRLDGNGQGELRDLLTLTPESLAMGALRTACLHYLLGDVPQAKASLTKAINLAPDLLHKREQVVQQIVGFGFGYASALDSRRGAVRFADEVFSNLPAAAAALAGLRPEVMGQIYAASAFESYQMGKRARAREDVLRAILCSPRRLRDRGMWAILLRSFAPGPSEGGKS